MAVEDPPLEKPRHHNADGSRAKRARENSNTRSICPVELIVCSVPLRIPRLLVTVSSEGPEDLEWVVPMEGMGR